MRLLVLWAALVACATPAPSREIVIAMNEFAFLPDVIEVAPGERVRLTVRNIGRIEHDFVPDQRGRAFGLPDFHLRPASSASQDWTAPTKPEQVSIVCSLPGHKERGMVARLIVR